MTQSSKKLTLFLDKDLEEIIPEYLERRQQDLKTLAALHEQANFDAIQNLGHRMKGSGAAYGFEKITHIGSDLEHAAKHQASDRIQSSIATLETYLARVHVVYA